MSVAAKHLRTSGKLSQRTQSNERQRSCRATCAPRYDVRRAVAWGYHPDHDVSAGRRRAQPPPPMPTGAQSEHTTSRRTAQQLCPGKAGDISVATAATAHTPPTGATELRWSKCPARAGIARAIAAQGEPLAQSGAAQNVPQAKWLAVRAGEAVRPVCYSAITAHAKAAW